MSGLMDFFGTGCWGSTLNLSQGAGVLKADRRLICPGAVSWRQSRTWPSMIRSDNVDPGRERQRNGMNRTSSASVRLRYELGERLQLQLGDGEVEGHRQLTWLANANLVYAVVWRRVCILPALEADIRRLWKSGCNGRAPRFAAGSANPLWQSSKGRCRSIPLPTNTWFSHCSFGYRPDITP